ncbi:hypothetical protein M9458_009562 [Cirrhinus mrigala]|uniref:Uncharacterized protein n=1 Tax=Cirrhinus mrigala TaxID=683832 RepID=A0ABD0RBU4_CIRMR
MDGPSLEWDEEYVLSESPPLKELRPDQEMLQERCCEEEELQALKQEEEEEVEHTETKGLRGKVKQHRILEDSTLSQTPLQDDATDRESQGEK